MDSVDHNLCVPSFYSLRRVAQVQRPTAASGTTKYVQIFAESHKQSARGGRGPAHASRLVLSLDSKDVVYAIDFCEHSREVIHLVVSSARVRRVEILSRWYDASGIQSMQNRSRLRVNIRNDIVLAVVTDAYKDQLIIVRLR